MKNLQIPATIDEEKLKSMLQDGKTQVEIQNEKAISEYKNFYRTHLSHLSRAKRDEALKQFTKIKYAKDDSKVIYSKQFEIDQLFSRYLKQPLKNIYDEDVKLAMPKIQHTDKLFDTALAAYTTFSQHDANQKAVKKEKQEKLINYIEQCLRDYGLHPKISNRSNNNKRYNLVIAGNGTKKYRILLTWKELDKDFLIKHSQKRFITIQGTEIKPSDIQQVKITSTKLKDDEIELFGLKNDFEWKDDFKDELAFIQCCKDETDYILNKQQRSIKAFYAEVQQLLQSYSDAHKSYSNALSKLESGIYERNMLDDLRLSLEQLCKELFENNKSLENQIKEFLGKYLKTKNVNPQITNLLNQLITFYTKYHNDYVKHNDKVNKSEVQFIFDLTSTFMIFLISI